MSVVSATGAQGGAVDREARDEFGDEVLRVGRGAAVAADHEFLAGLHGLGGELAGFDDGGMDRFVVEDLGEGVEGLLELAADEIGHGFREQGSGVRKQDGLVPLALARQQEVPFGNDNKRGKAGATATGY